MLTLTCIVGVFKKFICFLVHSFRKCWLAALSGAGQGTEEVTFLGS